MDEFEYARCILDKYCVVTAKILYHMPDYPGLLQTYVWQEVDLPPQYPRLQSFLRFWNENLDGPVHSVCVAHSVLMFERDSVYHARGEFLIH